MSHVHRLRDTDRIFFVTANLCRALAPFRTGEYAKLIAAIEASRAKLGFKLLGSVLASDAFFPFADGIEEAGKAGVTAVVQPGGSKHDQEVIDAANRLGLAMLFTGRRHFRH